MSGYAGEVLALNFPADSGAAYIGKPFTPEALAEKVKTVLGSQPIC